MSLEPIVLEHYMRRYSGVDTLDEPVTTTIVRNLPIHTDPRLICLLLRLEISSQSTPNLFKFYTLEEVLAVKFSGSPSPPALVSALTKLLGIGTSGGL